MEELKFFVKENGIKLVLIDALMEVVAGADENSVKEMNPPLMAIRDLTESTGCAVIIIHHAGKVSKKTDAKNATFRGSSAIKGAVDFMIQVHKENDLINLSTSKVRDTEDFEIDAEMVFTDFSFHMVKAENTKVNNGMTKMKLEILSFLYKNTDSETPTILKAITGVEKTINNNLSDLKKSGYLISEKGGGRANVYNIHPDKKADVYILINKAGLIDEK
jgi:RecA-family ATPase